MAEAIQTLEKAYTENRDVLLGEDGSVRTPLTVLREVAKDYGTPIHLEFHEVHVTPAKVVFQVEMYSGRLRGRGEAPRRRLAVQIAAFDLLMKVEAGGFEVPLYGMLPGTRINPNIFRDLADLCRALDLQSPMYVLLPNDPEAVVEELFTYKCQVGQLIKIGKSDSRFLAQRIAAKSVFEAITNSDVGLDEVQMGADCHALENYNIQPGTSQKKVEIMKFRLESRVQEEQAATARVEFQEDDFGDNMESRSDTPSKEVSEKLGQLNLHEIRDRVKNLSLLEGEVFEAEEEF